MDFGQALEAMKQGEKVARRGWNGKGIFIEMQRPDTHSKMTNPYIFIDSTGLITNNPDAPKNRVPWAPSQTDMLAEDWGIITTQPGDTVNVAGEEIPVVDGRTSK